MQAESGFLLQPRYGLRKLPPLKMRAASTTKKTNPAKAQAKNSAGDKTAAKAHRKSNPPDVAAILAILATTYGDATCALTHRDPFQLAVATILSAQCTDQRVNMVTPALFARYPTPAALAAADPAEVATIIRSTGVFNNKTKSLIGFAQAIVGTHGGQVPQSMEALRPLPGIGRKTANVVLGTGFRIAVGVVVDTHVKRIAHRLGLTNEEAPEKVEQDLIRLLPQSAWIDFSHQIIWHGRRICQARKPQCEICPLAPHCRFFQTGMANA